LEYYFKLQYWRLKREIKSFGVNPYAGILFYLLSFIAFSELIFKKVNSAPYIYPFIAVIITYTLGEESRNEFLKFIFPDKKYIRIRLAENLLYAIPFSTFLVFKNQYLMSLLTLALSGIMSLLNNVSRIRFQIPSPLSRHPYEFTVGFRRFYLVIIGIYILTFISIYHHNLNLGLFSLVILFLLCLTFYSHLDPIFYVWIHAQSPKIFLIHKIKTALFYGFCLSLVIILPLVYFYKNDIQIISLTLGVGILYIIVGVLSVYVNYPKKMTLSQQFQLCFGVLFPPLLLLVIPNFYLQATNRLKVYLKC
jgi:hypothetical protein